MLLALVAVLSCILVVTARAKPSWPCYRCGGPATVEYMGLHYCGMCRQVIVAMIGTVGHDPPYGFPGAKGYLEFPGKEPK
jgi:hypothetical protein